MQTMTSLDTYNDRYVDPDDDVLAVLDDTPLGAVENVLDGFLDEADVVAAHVTAVRSITERRR